MTAPVVVWGNCQARPLAQLLSAPLAAVGMEVVDVPPVFEVDPAGLARVRDLLGRAAAFVTHPVADEYRVPGCGSDQLAALLPAGGRTVRVASCYDRGPYPWQVTAHDGTGARVAAPLTDYHDLRVLAAAGRGDRDWDTPPPAGALAAVADGALAELRRREDAVDVPVSDLVRTGMFTVNHPANAVLAAVAQRVLAALGVEGRVQAPEREFLGATRTPLEPAVADVVGVPPREGWALLGERLSRQEVAAAHLDWYATRPDVVADARVRYAALSTQLGLLAD